MSDFSDRMSARDINKIVSDIKRAVSNAESSENRDTAEAWRLLLNNWGELTAEESRDCYARLQALERTV